MANTVIQLKKSATPASVPASLANGELALNFADGVLYYKAANGSIASISGSGGGTGLNYGIVNANGTLVVADSSGATFAILPGDFITVTGDSINDRVTIGANVKVVYDTANAAFNYANGLSVGSATGAFGAANQAGVVANAAYDKANSANVLAYNTGIGANDYTNTSTTAANNYAGAMANSANAYAASLTPDLSPAFNKANDSYIVANAAFDKANSANVLAYNTGIGANAYAVTVGTSSNAYSVSIGSSGNAYTQAVGTAGNTYASSIGTSSNAWASATFGTITNTTASFAAANQSGVIANSAFDNANAAFGRANTGYLPNVRAFSVTTTANLSANVDNTDICIVTAQASTLNIGAPIGTSTEGERLMLRIKDSGVSRTLTWNVIFRVVGVTLPTATVVSKNLYVGLSYNSADSKWDVIAIAQE